MTDRTKQVLAGWLNLTDAERKEFDDEVRRFQTQNFSEREAFRKSIGTKVTLGPVGAGCLCCGR